MAIKALEANLRRTAVEVEIPAEHGVLLEVTGRHLGVSRRAAELLREINHRYVGWERTLDDLHRHATGDFYVYLQHERGPEGLGLLSTLYRTITEAAEPPETRDRALRLWLSFLEKVAREARADPGGGGAVLKDTIAQLSDVLGRRPSLAVRATHGLKRLTSATAGLGVEAEPALTACRRLLAGTLGRLYHDWLAREDPEAWWRRHLSGLPDGPPVERPHHLNRITHRSLRDYLVRIDGLASAGPIEGGVGLLLELPDQAQLMWSYLEAAPLADGHGGALGEVTWLTHILRSEALAPVHEQALSRVTRSCRDLLRSAELHEQRAFIRDTIAALGSAAADHVSSGLELVRRMGLEILPRGERTTCDCFLDEVLRLPFHFPAFEGYTDACSIRVNPAHKQNLRVHLELIGANPSAASKLLATLTARLKAGGVFIADTDMLQRDVSRLLGRQIGPVYHHAKQLLRLLPVYFNDIGAEGELRRVSTRFDELEARTDPLCHFLRKQSHVESNPFLTRVLEHVARYWATGDATALRSCVPASVYDALPSLWREQEGLHEIMRTVADRAEDPAHILDLGVENAVRAIGDLAATHPVAAEKVELLFRFYRELERKYCLDHEDLLERLSGSSAISAGALSRLERALAQGSSDLALEELLGTLERLQEIVLSVGPPEAIEDIYLKRHIAAGIPSMYGSYRERRLEALGLTYRIESLASALLARRIEGLRLSGVSLLELEEVLGCLRLLRRALRIDGFKTGRIDAALSMLGEALAAGIDRTGQYLDIFHLLSRGLEEIVERDFLDFYEGVYTRVLAELESRPGHERSEATQPLSGVDSSEAFLRSLLTEAFGLGLADGLCTRVIHALNTRGIGALDVPVAGEAHRRLVADWTVPIGEGRASSVVRLGNKGANLGTLARHGLPVPPGFIITTDLCNCGVRWDDHRAWSEGVVATIRSRLAELETSTGERLGDPDRPLLLSVRGGAPISMPGMLDSFLNVGLNPSLADRIALTRSRPWATWDAYRRFVQLWGMSHGVARDAFDRLIQREKSVSGVGKKAQLPAERMRRLALEYRALVLDHGIAVVDDPFDQLLHCVGLVLASWGADKARLYRRELHVSEAWGTGVVIQGMVFGNLDASSGTGVVLTRASVHEPGKIRLFGDFVVQGQGDDVVSGLVETLPITERQRQERRRPADGSLEQDFPDVYRALLGHATRMVCDLDMPQQEIEFTFESPSADRLYLLQTRDAVLAGRRLVPTFAPSEALDGALVATGIGACGGALSGRIARTLEEIEAIRRLHPEEPVILIRPDTVPDDLHLMLRADGVLTSVGGATSHAAVVAKRLSKTCVVGCRELDVFDDAAGISLVGRRLAAGDLLSINGLDGFVYLGSHPTTLTSVAGRA